MLSAAHEKQQDGLHAEPGSAAALEGSTGLGGLDDVEVGRCLLQQLGMECADTRDLCGCEISHLLPPGPYYNELYFWYQVPRAVLHGQCWSPHQVPLNRYCSDYQ